MMALAANGPTSYIRPRPGVQPRLRLVTPHKAPSRAVYRRRRLFALGLVLLLGGLIVAAAQMAWAAAGAGPLAASGGGPAAGQPAAARIWTVRPGDTLWSIARAVHPSGDVRPLVDRLASEVGGGDLYPGEAIPIP